MLLPDDLIYTLGIFFFNVLGSAADQTAYPPSRTTSTSVSPPIPNLVSLPSRYHCMDPNNHFHFYLRLVIWAELGMNTNDSDNSKAVVVAECMQFGSNREARCPYISIYIFLEVQGAYIGFDADKAMVLRLVIPLGIREPAVQT